MQAHKTGDLRIWWIPQIPGAPFMLNVKDAEEGVMLMAILAKYDLFQFHRLIKPDYYDIGGFEIFEDDEWTEWYSEDGEDINEWLQNNAQSRLRERILWTLSPVVATLSPLVISLRNVQRPSISMPKTKIEVDPFDLVSSVETKVAGNQTRESPAENLGEHHGRPND